MKTNYLVSVALAVVCLIVTSLACVSTASPTATPVPPTSTPTAIPPTKRPTSTPKPTATLIPTPAPVGSPVIYDSLEITVLDVVNRDSIHFGDVSGGFETFYKPLEGHFIIDVGVLVHNPDQGNIVRVKWKDVYIVESSGDAWYPVWGQTKTVSPGTKVDPFSIGLSSSNVDGNELIEFENNTDTYLRLIFSVVNDPEQTILFAIENSHFIQFHVEE